MNLWAPITISLGPGHPKIEVRAESALSDQVTASCSTDTRIGMAAPSKGGELSL